VGSLRFLKRVSRRVAGSIAGFGALLAGLAGLSPHMLTAFVMLGGLVISLGVVVILAVLGCGLFRWVIDDDARSDRVNRMLLARRGDAKCLEPSSPAPSSPASQAESPGSRAVRARRRRSR
jgi:hypothetical protein